MTKERIDYMGKQYNLKSELKDTADTIRCGYISSKDAEFIAWMCAAALERIEKLEKLISFLKMG